MRWRCFWCKPMAIPDGTREEMGNCCAPSDSERTAPTLERTAPSPVRTGVSQPAAAAAAAVAEAYPAPYCPGPAVLATIEGQVPGMRASMQAKLAGLTPQQRRMLAHANGV